MTSLMYCTAWLPTSFWDTSPICRPSNTQVIMSHIASACLWVLKYSKVVIFMISVSLEVNMFIMVDCCYFCKTFWWFDAYWPSYLIEISNAYTTRPALATSWPFVSSILLLARLAINCVFTWCKLFPHWPHLLQWQQQCHHLPPLQCYSVHGLFHSGYIWKDKNIIKTVLEVNMIANDFRHIYSFFKCRTNGNIEQ